MDVCEADAVEVELTRADGDLSSPKCRRLWDRAAGYRLCPRWHGHLWGRTDNGFGVLIQLEPAGGGGA